MLSVPAAARWTSRMCARHGVGRKMVFVQQPPGGHRPSGRGSCRGRDRSSEKKMMQSSDANRRRGRSRPSRALRPPRRGNDWPPQASGRGNRGLRPRGIRADAHRAGAYPACTGEKSRPGLRRSGPRIPALPTAPVSDCRRRGPRIRRPLVAPTRRTMTRVPSHAFRRPPGVALTSRAVGAVAEQGDVKWPDARQSEIVP